MSGVDLKMGLSSVDFTFCSPVAYWMSNVEHFFSRSVGLKNWTMLGVGKTPFMGTNDVGTRLHTKLCFWQSGVLGNIHLEKLSARMALNFTKWHITVCLFYDMKRFVSCCCLLRLSHCHVSFLYTCYIGALFVRSKGIIEGMVTSFERLSLFEKNGEFINISDFRFFWNPTDYIRQ